MERIRTTLTALFAGAAVIIVCAFGAAPAPALAQADTQTSTAAQTQQPQTQQAKKGWPGGEVSHAREDSGYIAPIIVLCNDDLRVVYLYRGDWSKGVGGCADVNYIYVPDDGTYRECYTPINTRRVFRHGYHEIGNFTALKCYARR